MFWSIEEFCDSFIKLIDHLELGKVGIVVHRFFFSRLVMCRRVVLVMFIFLP